MVPEEDIRGSGGDRPGIKDTLPQNNFLKYFFSVMFTS